MSSCFAISSWLIVLAWKHSHLFCVKQTLRIFAGFQNTHLDFVGDVYFIFDNRTQYLISSCKSAGGKDETAGR